jgi:hypothetical protein
MLHPNEELGITLLMGRLKNSGHTVRRLHGGTLDLEVDGQRTEVKMKAKSFDALDFISLTQRQQEAATGRDYEIYLVCGIKTSTPGFYKISSKALIAKEPRVVTSYEYDLKLLRDIVEPI